MVCWTYILLHIVLTGRYGTLSKLHAHLGRRIIHVAPCAKAKSVRLSARLILCILTRVPLDIALSAVLRTRLAGSVQVWVGVDT
jgi:hypothetical protein